MLTDRRRSCSTPLVHSAYNHAKGHTASPYTTCQAPTMFLPSSDPKLSLPIITMHSCRSMRPLPKPPADLLPADHASCRSSLLLLHHPTADTATLPNPCYWNSSPSSCHTDIHCYPTIPTDSILPNLTHAKEFNFLGRPLHHCSGFCNQPTQDVPTEASFN